MITKKPQASRQPRPATFAIERTATYKAPVRLEQQKLGREDEKQQLALFEQKQIEVVRETMAKEEGKQGTTRIVVGLDLSISEDKALSAIQKMLAKTDYKGNQPGLEIAVKDTPFHIQAYLPRLEFGWTEYFEAYGLKQIGGKYVGKTAQEARDALFHGLTRSQLVCYEKKRWEGAGEKRKQVIDIIRTTAPLVRICELFTGLNKDEASRVEAGEAMAERVTRIVVEASPLLVDGIETFYMLKPAALHQEIAQLFPGKRPARAISLFCLWLLTLDYEAVPIHKHTLAHRLRLGRMVRDSRTTELDAAIDNAIWAARELGFLLKYSVEAGGLFRFWPNPDRCRRVKKGKFPGAEAGDEKDSN